MKGAIAVALVALGGCHCGGESPATTPPPEASGSGSADAAVPPTAPISDADSTKAIGCILTRARNTQEVLRVLAENLAPPALIRRTIDVALARAKEDGETPVARVLADAVIAYTESNDRDALVSTFQAIDRLSDTSSILFGHLGPHRTRAGLAIDHKDFAGDELAITTERALAGDKAGATRFYDALASKSNTWRGLEEKVAALVAIDRIADAKALIAAAEDEERLKLAGAWLDVELRRAGPIDEPLQVMLAEIPKAPDLALGWWSDRAAFRRAARLGRAKELAPLYKALKARYETDKNQATLESTYELATLVGDTADVRALESDPRLADAISTRSGPIEAALAMAKAHDVPAMYAQIWLRASKEPVPSTFGATLVRTVCPPDLGPRPPAAPPLAGAKLTAKEKSRGMRQECHLHDVIVTLVDASGTKLGTETIAGQCTGACTAAEKRAGQQHLDEIHRLIDEGEATLSETDYNFTDCMFVGPDEGRTRVVAGRQLALIPIHGIGAHDVPNTSYQIALEVCGAVHVLEPFGEMYAHHWEPRELTFRESADKSQIVVDGASSFYKGVVARIALPDVCPGVPHLEALPTE